MNRKKLALNHLLDIGGIATLNNLYSPTAQSPKGGLLGSRKLIKGFLSDGLIEKLPTIGKPANKAHEVFYCLTRKGAQYIGRVEEYKYKKYPKSPYNVMHESMKFDIALAFLRLYPFTKFSFRYDANLFGVRPDILVRMEPMGLGHAPRFLVIEIERKKTVDRIFHEKVQRYEDMFEKLKHAEGMEEADYTVLFIYTHIWFNVFLRPQEYAHETVRLHIQQIHEMLFHLASTYCKHLSPQRYRFISFHNIFRLNEQVWHKPAGPLTFLLDD